MTNNPVPQSDVTPEAKTSSKWSNSKHEILKSLPLAFTPSSQDIKSNNKKKIIDESPCT